MAREPINDVDCVTKRKERVLAGLFMVARCSVHRCIPYNVDWLRVYTGSMTSDGLGAEGVQMFQSAFQLSGAPCLLDILWLQKRSSILDDWAFISVIYNCPGYLIQKYRIQESTSKLRAILQIIIFPPVYEIIHLTELFVKRF